MILLRDAGSVPIVTLPTLVAMKRPANREQDRIDLDNLRLLYPQQSIYEQHSRRHRGVRAASGGEQIEHLTRQERAVL